MAFSKIGGKGIDLSTDIITEFNSTGVDDNATATTITLNANNTATIPNVTGNTTFNEYITVTNLTVNNDASISNDLTVGGNFIITGNTFTVDSTSLKIEDSLIHLAGNNVSSDIIDIGFIGHYSNDSGNTELFTGFYRDATDEKYYLFHNLSDDINTATTIDKTGTGYTLAHLNVGNLNANGIFTIGDRGSATEELTIFHENNVSYLISDSSAGGGSKGEFSFRTNDGGTAGERVRIDGAGNVGIGTSSPNLHGWVKAITLNTSTNAAYELGQSGTKYGAFAVQGDGRVQMTNFTANPLTFQTNNTERMRIDGDGNVGIGTASPAAELHINNSSGATFTRISGTTAAVLDMYGGASNTKPIRFFGGSDTEAYAGIRALSNNLGLSFETGVGGATAATERMRIDSSGNVGIGTSSPPSVTNYKYLAVHATTNSYLHLTNSTTGSTSADGFDVAVSGLDAVLINREAGNLRFSTSDTERMRIDSSGNIGVGVAPESWATYTPIQVQQSSLASFNNGDARLTNNGYYNGGWKYIDSRYATQYLMDASNGIHTWSTAVSGSADGAITWSERMRIAADGRITLKARTDFDDLLIGTGAGKYMQVTGSSGSAWTMSSSGGASVPGTASTSFGLHHWNGSAWSEKFTVQTSGNVGIGVTPLGSAAGAFTQLQMGGGNSGRSTFFGQSNDHAMGIVSGAYYDASNNLKYATSNRKLSHLYLFNGEFEFSSAPAGTGGATATLTQRVKIDSDGNVGIGLAPTNISAYKTLEIGQKSGSKRGRIQFNTDQGDITLYSYEQGTQPYLGLYTSHYSGTYIARFDSDGLKFGQDTAAANALDDYEEGNWTPTVSTASSVTIYRAQYTKIGRTVTVSCYIAWTNNQNNNTGTWNIGGLPYQSALIYNYEAAAIGYTGAVKSDDFLLIKHSNSSYYYLHRSSGGNSAVFTNADITSRGLNVIIFTATYQLPS